MFAFRKCYSADPAICVSQVCMAGNGSPWVGFLHSPKVKLQDLL